MKNVFHDFLLPGYSGAMTQVSRPHPRRLSALLGLLLLVAQSLALAHAYQHDIASPVDNTCASCVIGGQLAHGCADTASDCAPGTVVASHEVRTRIAFDTVIIPAANQRGPPA